MNGYEGLHFLHSCSIQLAIGRVRADNAIGTQLWLATPVEGVRLGAAAQTYRWGSQDAGGNFANAQHVYELQGSLDATFSRAMLRAETELQHYETDHYYASYLQLGAALPHAPKVWVHALGEYAYERAWAFDSYPRDFDWHRAAGLGVNYKLSPTFVLKAEHHWNRGIQVEQSATPVSPPRFQYTMLSASASF